MNFQDYFSGHAADYAKYRPDYPRALFSWLTSVAPRTGTAVDCATGNGQAARGLAEFFDHVDALDASEDQIANAEGPPNIRYFVATAEATTMPDSSADVVTIAQALHWLDHPKYFAEVQRILRPGGVFAAWGYARFLADEPISAISRELLWKPLEAYWPPERRLVETAYATLEFPFDELAAPALSIELDWTRENLTDYVHTWSASKNYVRQKHGNAIQDFEAALAKIWPAGVRRRITMPVFVRAGRTKV